MTFSAKIAPAEKFDEKSLETLKRVIDKLSKDVVPKMTAEDIKSAVKQAGILNMHKR